MENIIAICKDCGNGTLNGKTNPQFHMYEGRYNDVVVCNRCDSSHVDVVSTGDADDVEFENRYGVGE
jgi:hypothetical protein